MNNSIRIRNLTKTYKVFDNRRLLVAQPIHFFTQRSKNHQIYALNDVSFDVERGQIFGIIGHNGSGKSTLLKIMSGVTRADKGLIEIEGRVTSLLELGVGFEPELTGRENIYLYGSLLDIPRQVMAEREELIIKFSGIRRFIDTPVKTFSSGMLIRLAFSAAIYSEPDVLLLDEVLGVGDNEFRHKSFQAIQKVVERGATVLLVSHGLSLIGGFCDRVMCLNQGRVAGIGAAGEVVQIYVNQICVRDKICEISKGNLLLRFLPTGFHIEKSGIVYTVSKGLSVNLKKWEADFTSSEAGWTIIELKEDEVILQLRWGHWNLEQLWHIRIVDDCTVDWIIENGPNLHLEVDSMEIEAMVSGSYRAYILPEEIRDFPNTDNRGFNMEYLLAQQHPRRFLGVTNATDNHLAMIMDYSQSPLTGACMIVTGGNLMPGHIIQRGFAAQSAEKKIHTRIHLMDEQSLSCFYQEKRKKLYVSDGFLTLALQEKSLMMYMQKDPITRFPGLHVSDRSGSPMECEWEDIDADHGLHLRATCTNLPVVVVWKLKADTKRIFWNADLEILDYINVAEFHLILPLQSSPDGRINFDFFDTWNNDIQSLTSSHNHCFARAENAVPARVHLGSGFFSMEFSG